LVMRVGTNRSTVGTTVQTTYPVEFP